MPIHLSVSLMLLCPFANLKCALSHCPARMCLTWPLVLDAPCAGLNRAGQLCYGHCETEVYGEWLADDVLCAQESIRGQMTGDKPIRQEHFLLFNMSKQAAQSFVAVSLSGDKVRSALVFTKQ